MPRPDVSNYDRFLRRLYKSSVTQGIFGWPIAWYSMRYLVQVGYVQIIYSWDDRKVRAELTAEGRAHVERETADNRLVLSPQ